jgi:hypothetical protein
VLSAVLLLGIPVVAITGLLSYAAYNPRLPGNDLTPGRGLLGFYLFDWPTRPIWLYRFNQGLHVTVGIRPRPCGAGQALVGRAQAVRLATGGLGGACPGAGDARPPRGRRALPVRHRDP